MSLLPDDGRMKPMIVLPPDTMSAEDIKALRENGLCVVEAKNPAAVKFIDPIPSTVGRDRIEQAAIDLSRKILSREFWASRNYGMDRKEISAIFVDLLTKGSALDPSPRQEQEEEYFTDAKLEEIQKIAREEARAEAAAKKAAKLAAQKK